MSSYPQPQVIPVWTHGVPGAVPSVLVERVTMDPPGQVKIVRNITQPTLTIYRPSGDVRTQTAVIVSPGGAFHFLAYEHEGSEVAQWLADRGVTALVLKYRVRPTSANDDEFFAGLRDWAANREASRAEMTEVVWLGIADGQQAVRVTRGLAGELGVSPRRIGMIGFSAGARVTAEVALLHDEESRPDFVAPIYGGPQGEYVVPADAPPMFLAFAADDVMAVRTSIPLFSKWRDADKSAELHVYARGGHGFGMRKQGLPSDTWIERYGDWLGGLGLMDTTARV